ncbi:hypothetical protein Aduo_002637 [Ancylostoma duodenale]
MAECVFGVVLLTRKWQDTGWHGSYLLPCRNTALTGRGGRWQNKANSSSLIARQHVLRRYHLSAAGPRQSRPGVFCVLLLAALSDGWTDDHQSRGEERRSGGQMVPLFDDISPCCDDVPSWHLQIAIPARAAAHAAYRLTLRIAQLP